MLPHLLSPVPLQLLLPRATNRITPNSPFFEIMVLVAPQWLPVPSSSTPSFHVSSLSHPQVHQNPGRCSQKAISLPGMAVANNCHQAMECSCLSLVLMGNQCSAQSSSCFQREQIRKQSLSTFARTLSLQVSWRCTG